MEVVESKKFTTKFGNKVNLVIRAGSMTARNDATKMDTKREMNKKIEPSTILIAPCPGLLGFLC